MFRDGFEEFRDLKATLYTGGSSGTVLLDLLETRVVRLGSYDKRLDVAMHDCVSLECPI